MSRAVRVGVFRDARREVRKRVPLQAGGTGFTTVFDGYEVADIVVEVDVELLARAIGEKAMRSKRGVSKLQGGAVTVRATNRKRIPA